MTTSPESFHDLDAADQAAVDAALAWLRDRGGLATVPIDLERIRKREDLLVLIKRQDLTFGFVREYLQAEYGVEIDGEPDRRGLEGYIFVDPWVQLIFLNVASGTKHHEGRQRYSYAHELGHYFLDAKPLLATDPETGFQLACSYAEVERPRHVARGGYQAARAFQIERRANRFAAELLMPRDDLVSFLAKRRRGLSLELVGEIADRYQTSFRAAAFRLIEVTDQPCALVISNPKAVISHYALSQALRARRCYHLRRGLAIGKQTSVWRMANHVIRDRRPIMGWHDARQWFPGTPERHPPVLEWTQGFKSYSVFLSLLHFDHGIPSPLEDVLLR